MADPIADAFVVIRPDFTGFTAQLEAGVKAAVARVQANVRTNVSGIAPTSGAQATVQTAVAVETAGAVAGAQAVTAALGEEAVVTGVVTKESLSLANAHAAVASSDAAVARATQAYNLALAKEGVDAERTVVALSTLTAATARQTAANERLAFTSSGPGSAGFFQTQKGANAARGALIGLSRITPLTVFGLQATGVAAIIAGAAIARSISSAAEFEKQLNTFQAVTGVTADQLSRVRDEALALGADTRLAAQSAGDAAVAMTELAKAGLTVEDSIAAARGVLELAGAAEIQAGEAAKIVAGQLNAFSLAGDQAVRVVDLLASASIAAQGEISDFAFAFQQVSSVAASANVSIEQQTALLVELAKAGIQGADAGTSLRTFLLRLVPTTKQAAEFTKALGVELDGTKTEGAQLASVIEQYRSVLSLLTPIQRTNVLNQIFGQDAYRASAVIFGQNAGELGNLIDALDNEGIAAALNQAKSEGLAGAAAGLRSNLETVGIELGKLVDGPLEQFVRGLSDAVTETTTLVTKIGDLGSAAASAKIPVINIPFKVVITGGGAVGEWFRRAALLPVATATGAAPLLLTKELLDKFVGIDEPTVAPAPIDFGLNKKFGIGAFLNNLDKQRQKLFDKTFGAAARANKDAQKEARAKAQAAIDKSQGIGAADKKIDLDVTAPQKLQVALLKAQLTHSLQAELGADIAVRDYFEKRIDGVKQGSKRYLKLLGALQNADAAAQGIRDRISSDRDRISSERKRAADAAEAQRKKDLRDAQDRVEKAKAAALALFNLSVSQIDLEIQAATLTVDDKTDDERAIKKKINRIQLRIDALNKIKSKTTEQNQAIVDLKKEILTLRGNLLGLSETAGGFTLSDLFKEAVNELNEFGSNVSSGVTIGGGARAAVAGAIAARNPNLSPADRAKLTATGTTNDLLAEILAVLANDAGDGSTSSSGAPPDYGTPAYYRLPPGQRAMTRARAHAVTVRGD
jgi:TP901 family phage tail tape measure protein